ncbi:hypothetical protein PLICRDRAFT_33080 [Plicaturopsis crispa FD-325 SS-3]|uniref:Uncharacterized protein n=1 Tax=Plicaturopsis crispa FD-325 SS-3 TaxID=944288 RepID=A0A0C9SPX2_PLICR|nr:hypothetical protein PLICRDRAFT_33080 [Plicaturopsis crispa FD-325 SS-3]
MSSPGPVVPDVSQPREFPSSGVWVATDFETYKGNILVSKNLVPSQPGTRDKSLPADTREAFRKLVVVDSKAGVEEYNRGPGQSVGCGSCSVDGKKCCVVVNNAACAACKGSKQKCSRIQSYHEWRTRRAMDNDPIFGAWGGGAAFARFLLDYYAQRSGQELQQPQPKAQVIVDLSGTSRPPANPASPSVGGPSPAAEPVDGKRKAAALESDPVDDPGLDDAAPASDGEGDVTPKASGSGTVLAKRRRVASSPLGDAPSDDEGFDAPSVTDGLKQDLRAAREEVSDLTIRNRELGALLNTTRQRMRDYRAAAEKASAQSEELRAIIQDRDDELEALQGRLTQSQDSLSAAGAAEQQAIRSCDSLEAALVQMREVKNAEIAELRRRVEAPLPVAPAAVGASAGGAAPPAGAAGVALELEAARARYAAAEQENERLKAELASRSGAAAVPAQGGLRAQLEDARRQRDDVQEALGRALRDVENLALSSTHAQARCAYALRNGEGLRDQLDDKVQEFAELSAKYALLAAGPPGDRDTAMRAAVDEARGDENRRGARFLQSERQQFGGVLAALSVEASSIERDVRAVLAALDEAEIDAAVSAARDAQQGLQRLHDAAIEQARCRVNIGLLPEDLVAGIRARMDE